MLERDQRNIIDNLSKFQGEVTNNDKEKLEMNKDNQIEEIQERKKKVLIQYAITLFNQLESVGRNKALKLLLLIRFITDEI